MRWRKSSSRRRFFRPAERTEIRSDADLLRSACDVGARPATRFCTVDRVLITRNEKCRFGRTRRIRGDGKLRGDGAGRGGGDPDGCHSSGKRCRQRGSSAGHESDFQFERSSEHAVEWRDSSRGIRAQYLGWRDLAPRAETRQRSWLIFWIGIFCALARNAMAHQRIECLS